MNEDYVSNIEEVFENVDQAEVISVSFPTFGKAVVIDTRSNETDGPMLRIMPIVSSPRERVRTLRRLRAGFPRVRNLTVIPWPGYVESLVALGIWDRIQNRFEHQGDDKSAEACQTILTDLRGLEKVEMAAAIRGDNYDTLWSTN